MKTSRHSLSLHPLAACLALVFCPPDAGAVLPHTAFVVENCLDHGPGSLRQTVIDDTAGEPIDLTQLALQRNHPDDRAHRCAARAADPGPGAATVHDRRRAPRSRFQPDLDATARTLRHDHPERLHGFVRWRLRLLGGRAPAQRHGDQGLPRLRHCQQLDDQGRRRARGHGALVAINSSIVDNEIYSALGNAIGGGALVDGLAVLDHSTISGNVVSGGQVNHMAAGGIDVQGGR